MAQISKSTLLECAPEKSATRIEEVFGWPQSNWDNGDAPAALAFMMLFPGGNLSPRVLAYEIFTALLLRSVALGNSLAFELMAVSHAVGAGFDPDVKKVEYWLYRAQDAGVFGAKKTSVLAPYVEQIIAVAPPSGEMERLLIEHFDVGT